MVLPLTLVLVLMQAADIVLLCMHTALLCCRLQDKVLRLLRECEGNILDDEQLLATLSNSKLTSAAIQVRRALTRCAPLPPRVVSSSRRAALIGD